MSPANSAVDGTDNSGVSDKTASAEIVADDTTEDEAATNTPAGTIVQIERGVVHQICSGQVVLTLATAVKELLENSLDAGATVVDIKLREMGSEMIEVSDNGVGVEERNFKGMTVKHATSKLREFTDILAVETFGFRGEALSSLCALSTLTISTRHKTSATGTLMTYDHHGNTLTSTTQAKPVGTTVTLANLFSTMPVRQKEFLRSLKSQFSKLVSILSAYGLVSSGVRIMVTNTRARGGRNVVLHTQGSHNIRDNLLNIFGSKQMGSLRPFSQVDLSAEDLSKANIRLHGGMPSVKLSGFISSPVHGEGRGAPDRQFYFVNSRPCDPTKLIKLVNQVYHSFNRHQFPFVCLDILTERSTVDINITPDKRQVFLTNEKFLNELVKKSLEKMFEDAPSTMEINTFLSKPNSMSSKNDSTAPEVTINKENEVSRSNIKETQLNISSLKRSFASSFSSPSSQTQNVHKKQKTLLSFYEVGASGDSETNGVTAIEVSNVDTENLETETENQETDFTISSDNSTSIIETKVEADDEVDIDGFGEQGDIQINVKKSERVESHGLTLVFDDFSPVQSDFTQIKHQVSLVDEKKKPGLSIIFDDFSDLKPAQTYVEENHISCGEHLKITFDNSPDADSKVVGEHYKVTASQSEVEVVVEKSKSEESNNTCGTTKIEVKVRFSFDDLRKSLTDIENSKSDLKCLKFKAQIKPTDNKSAEAELQKQIQKSDFANMKIFGQFNLGFLITGLKNDLFIIDQHATDEKYNFETLQRTTVIKSQKMVLPQRLELTSVNESILLDNLGVFEKNGFHFEVNESAPTTERVCLTSLPISKNWTFGKEDIDELIFMISEGGGEGDVNFRPSRVRAMFASRACRTSVMVGTSLSKQDMLKLVRHMGEIEQPWNCPHGRPTIRHLVNTEMVR